MIKIISVGKIKEDYLTDAINEYKKRLQKYTNIEIIEIPDEGLEDEIVVKRKEKDKIKKILNQKDFIITMEIDGKQLTSEEFAKKLDNINIANPNITFIIGGSYGLDEEIKQMSNYKLSFSIRTNI